MQADTQAHEFQNPQKVTSIRSPRLTDRRAKGSRNQVFAAADATLREGRRPTVDAIRESLGGGSQTTLVAHLNDWYRELGERLAAAETPLAGMPADASQLLQQLWRVASKAGQSSALESDGKADIAQRLLENERDGLAAQNKALETLNGELKTQRRNIERLLTDTRALLNRREAELGEERVQRAEAEQSLGRAMLDLEVLRARQAVRLSISPAVGAAKLRHAARTATAKRRLKAGSHTGPARPVKSTHRKTLMARRRKGPTPTRRVTKRPPSTGKARKITRRRK